MEANKNGTVWLIDPIHTKIRFEAKYLQITSVSGWFTEFEGTVFTSSDDFTDGQIQLTVYTNSIFTGNAERDNQLRSTDFFDVKKYPILFFKSNSVQVDGSKLTIAGNLQIKDVTEAIEFKALYTGSARDPMGNLKAGFEMSARLNRNNFNISWNQVFGQAGVLLSDEVKIFSDIQLLKVRPA